jgi:hypothetical protein
VIWSDTDFHYYIITDSASSFSDTKMNKNYYYLSTSLPSPRPIIEHSTVIKASMFYNCSFIRPASCRDTNGLASCSLADPSSVRCLLPPSDLHSFPPPFSPLLRLLGPIHPLPRHPCHTAMSCPIQYSLAPHHLSAFPLTMDDCNDIAHVPL